jgi:hypothetical protein
LTFTVGLAPGSCTLYAQATDSDGALGNPLALPSGPLTVSAVTVSL